MKSKNHYDAIIIGAGIGGLTLGAILSKINKKRVLILERHYRAGGQTHDFTRKNFKWDTGLHYVGELAKGEIARYFFDYITDHKLDWKSLPEYFDIFHYPDLKFQVSNNEENFRNDLIKAFPAEEKSIQKYFKDIKKAVLWNHRYYFGKILPDYLSWIFKLLNIILPCNQNLTVTDYFNKNFINKKLISILTSQWISYMMPPNEASFICHAVIAVHYLKGGFYPEGGSGNIAAKIKPVLEQNNGEILTGTEVTGIIKTKNKATGVTVQFNRDGTLFTEKYYAPLIISNTGIHNTYLKFLSDCTESKILNDIKNFKEGYSCLSLYLGFDRNPQDLGFTGANEWFYDDFDHDKIFKSSSDILDKSPNHCVLSFPSMKNDNENYSGEILYYLDYSVFEKWKNLKWQKRGTDYYELKDKIARKLINKIDGKFPGFADTVTYYELSTPLTMQHFTNREKGVYNGMPLTPQKYKKKWVSIRTSLKNFYITGTDVNFFGIIGGMMGGIATASFLNGGFGFFKILYKIFINSR